MSFGIRRLHTSVFGKRKIDLALRYVVLSSSVRNTIFGILDANECHLKIVLF